MARFWINLHLPAVILAMISVVHCAHNPGGGNVTDLMALLDFKNRITGDPLGIMASWNDSTHHCSWTGITCHPSNKRVQILSLLSQKLVGSLPPSIGNLSFLTTIEFTNNTFQGQLPPQIGRLSRLKHLNLSSNMLSGSIPSNLSHCTHLTILALDHNQLSGHVPSQLSSLSNLELLNLGVNNLTGTLPASFGNFSASQFFYLWLPTNNFYGSIPPEIGRLSGLRYFTINGNQFSGELPLSIYNISSLIFFSVGVNRFQGQISPDIGLKYPNLEKFGCSANNFTGEIPVSVGNATRLELIDFAANSLTGTVPSVLGNLPFLYWINFEYNFLGNRQTGDMNFLSSLTNSSNLEVMSLMSNQFGGELPGAVANLSTKLTFLRLGENPIHGGLPVGMGNLESLTLLHLGGCSFTGVIPDDIGKLPRLTVLNLSLNAFTGMIPLSLANLTSLIQLNLDSNRLQGSIPPQLGNCTSLLQLNISSNNLTGSIPKQVMSLSSLSIFLGLARNSFSGPLPVEVSTMVHLIELDVSQNKLSGEIPSSLSSCISLEFLLMGGNRFTGSIPESLGEMRVLEEIDFSHNKLSGKIPDFLGKHPFLRKLDLSYNNLEGEMPNQGIFTNASSVSIVGNKQLCGGAPSFNLPSCRIPKTKSNKNLHLRWIIPLTISVAVLIVLICVLSLCYITRKPKKQDNAASSLYDSLLVISYHELHRATNAFSAKNLIGSGSFGSVYKGNLGENGSSVAVKVLNLEQRGAIKSFMDECAILKSIKHRNLLKIITVCSGFDPQGQDFKCLVTEFMANGSLDAWVHPSRDARNEFPTRSLNIMERLNIAIDVASAVDYLHNHSHTPIIHCDLKPSNILLDEDLTAHVGDFGLAKFLLQSESRPLQHHSMSVELRGSIGYIPPEYGTSTKISTLGDVYSYGILLLELFTGKRPTDTMFNNDMNIHKYVATVLPEHVLEVLDPSLVSTEEEEREIHEAGELGREIECLVSVIKIGVSDEVVTENLRVRNDQLAPEKLRVRNVEVDPELCEFELMRDELTRVRKDELEPELLRRQNAELEPALIRLRNDQLEPELQFKGPITRLRAKKLQGYFQELIRKKFEDLEDARCSYTLVNLLTNEDQVLTTESTSPHHAVRI